MTGTRPAVGQMLMLGCDGLAPSSDMLRWIRHHDLGGFFVFGPNLGDRQQLSEMIAEMQAAAPGLPLFVAMDMEGGRVQLWREPHWRDLPMAQVLGARLTASGDASELLELGWQVGVELRSLGVNVDFAPVLDVHTHAANPIIGDRSYGSDPSLVARAALHFARGLQDAGVLATGKHFPGHGDTAKDSHVDLPVVDQPRQRLQWVELAPFRAAIEGGLQAFMSAHVVYPALDPLQPATVSPAICTDLLRDRLGFDGVLFTDDMAMKGVRQGDDLLAASIRAVQAGCDVVLSAFEYAEHGALLEGLEAAVANGTIPEQRVRESLTRIERVKRRWLVAS